MYYGGEDGTNRAHEEVFIAVHRQTGRMYGGKKNGTHIGYSKLGALKSAMTIDKLNKEDYHFISLTFVPDGESVVGEDTPLSPEFTILEGK